MTLPRRWAGHAQRAPQSPALEELGGARLDYATLEERSRRAAGRLHRAGLRPGDRVLTSAAARLELAVAHVACLRLGLVVVPANPAYRAPELAHLVQDARPRAALVDDAARAQALRAADASLQIWEPALELADGEPPPLDTAAPEAPALLGYTSGTTGRPKGAVLSHANLLAGAEALRQAWSWAPEDRLVLALPLFHMHGLGVGLHGTLHAGASALLVPRFEPGVVLRAIEAWRATLFFGVPTMYHRLAEAPDATALARLRLCVSGSAPLSSELHARIEKQCGQRILERYGMTETLMLTSNPLEGERRPGTVGIPLPGVELRLAGEPAEIQVRGPNVFAGYWERPEATAAAFTGDGWFRTGDLGERDEAGYLRIVGRTKELIISGGYNVYPREVEEALQALPGIAEACVVGEPSEEWGERVTAYVVASRPLALETLREALAGRLASYKHPRALHVVEALPRNALGKLQRHRLRAGRVLPEPA